MIECVFLPCPEATAFVELLIDDRIASIAPPPHYLGLAASPTSPSLPPTHSSQLSVLPICHSMSPSIAILITRLPLNPHVNGRKYDRYEPMVQSTMVQMNFRGTGSIPVAKLRKEKHYPMFLYEMTQSDKCSSTNFFFWPSLPFHI